MNDDSSPDLGTAADPVIYRSRGLELQAKSLAIGTLLLALLVGFSASLQAALMAVVVGGVVLAFAYMQWRRCRVEIDHLGRTLTIQNLVVAHEIPFDDITHIDRELTPPFGRPMVVWTKKRKYVATAFSNRRRKARKIDDRLIEEIRAICMGGR